MEPTIRRSIFDQLLYVVNMRSRSLPEALDYFPIYSKDFWHDQINIKMSRVGKYPSEYHHQYLDVFEQALQSQKTKNRSSSYSQTSTPCDIKPAGHEDLNGRTTIFQLGTLLSTYGIPILLGLSQPHPHSGATEGCKPFNPPEHTPHRSTDLSQSPLAYKGPGIFMLDCTLSG